MLRSSFLVVVVALATTSVAFGQPDTDAARIELEKGYALRKEGKFAEALPLLLDSYKRAPQLKTLINLADCEENLGKLVDALHHWAEARDDATAQGDSAIAKVAGDRVIKLEKRTPQVTLQLAADAPASAIVSWDGATVPASEIGAKRRVDPGKHVASVQVPGYPARSYDLQIAEGEDRVVQLSPAASAVTTTDVADVSASKSGGASPWRTIGWAAIGVGAASLAVGTFFGIEAVSKKSDANCPDNHCAGGGDPDALRTAVKDGNLSTLFFVAGGVLAAGGVALVVLTPKGEPAATTTTGSSFHATVSLLPNGVSLQGAW